MIGTGISHYRIIDRLGQGGMGIVYKAEDTKLDRTVALKLLPPHALASEDDRARFYREARAAAALNHTNIAHVYEIDEVPLSSDGGIPTSGGTSSGMAGGPGESRPFIAMEYIDGRTISDVIAKGPVPLKDVISYVSQIAEGLKAAHEAGVVHRDIKSGNIMLTSKGVVKILDFGLAKTAASTKLTQMGSTLGTVAYMSPEQAKGEEVDRRSDIWSTGVILYEMITGSLPFPGDYEQAIVYGILNEDPESLTTLRAGVPMALDAIMAKLLAKDRSLRYQHIDELPADLKAIDLDAVVRTSRIATTSMASRPATDGDSEPASPQQMLQAGSWWKRPLAWSLVLAAAVALGAAGSRLLSRSPAPVETSVKRLSLPIPGDKPITALDITPDGSLVVFVEEAGDPIRVLDLGNGSVRTLEGTEGASVLRVSPDGNWVMMTMISGVKRVSLFGGKPMSVVDATTEPGPYTAWGPDETLIYEDFGRLWIKPIVGGEPRQLTDQEQNESDHDWPYVLPDEKTMIATIEYDGGTAGIGMWDLETGERIGILEVGGYAPRWIPTGHLVFEDSGELIAVPFDLSSLKLAGVPVSLGSFVDARTFAVSRGGTFVSAEATATSVLRGRTSVINHVEIDGGRRTLSFEPQDYWDMQLSPDGSRLALEIGQGVGRQDVWVIGLSDGLRHRLSFDNRGSEPVWSLGSDSVLYVERRVTDFPGSRLLVQSADGTGEPAVVYSESSGHLEYPDWSADGRYIMFAKSNLDTGFDRGLVYNRFATAADSLMLLDTADRTIRLVSAGARRGRFSPDGRFIAYEHRNHVYVKPRTLDGGVWDVSDGPGFAPDWSGDGRHLFFNREFSIMRVDVAPQGSRVSFGNPREIVRLQTTEVSYTPTADGNGFYLTGLPFTDAASTEDTGGEATAPRSLDVVINWFEHVKRLSPAP